MSKKYVVTVIEHKGQLCIPIPQEFCDELDIHKGTQVSIDITPDRKGLIIKKVFPPKLTKHKTISDKEFLKAVKEVEHKYGKALDDLAKI